MALLKKKAQTWKPAPTRKSGQGQRSIAMAAVAIGVGTLILNIVGAKASQGKTEKIVVASTSIPAGTPVTTNEVTLKPITGLPNGLASTSLVVGQEAIHGIVAGEPITASMVAKKATRLGLAAGQVGLWINVNLVTSALVHPGDIVDVVFASNGGGGTQQAQQQIQSMQGQVLVSGTRVVQVANSNGQIIGGQSSSGITNASNASVPAAVELAVSQQQATQLVSAQTLGTLTLVQDPWSNGQTSAVPGFTPTNIAPTNAVTGTGTVTSTTPSTSPGKITTTTGNSKAPKSSGVKSKA